ncbi:LuxR family transcriptional regulator [Salinactinospora qingdaonensis]
MVPPPGVSHDGAPEAPSDLNDDDLHLLAEIATGVTTDVAARRLELSARTLRRRLRAICDRLGVNTPIEAVVWAARRQLI